MGLAPECRGPGDDVCSAHFLRLSALTHPHWEAGFLGARPTAGADLVVPAAAGGSAVVAGIGGTACHRGRRRSASLQVQASRMVPVCALRPNVVQIEEGTQREGHFGVAVVGQFQTASGASPLSCWRETRRR
jgi:hypothetical protein